MNRSPNSSLQQDWTSGDNYLLDTTMRLAAGMGRLPASVRERHTEFLLQAQQADGGFAGRLGSSDLYYTSFAIRTLAILGQMQGDHVQHAAEFLQSQLDARHGPVDLVSLVLGVSILESSTGIQVLGQRRQAWQAQVVRQLEALRRDDGGFAKGSRGSTSSTYHTFLALICLQLINHPLSDPPAVVRFILSQQADHGGFREIYLNKRAGTNPTAAAMSVLRILHAVDPPTRQQTVEFLSHMQNSEGGLLANRRIPIADVLSTFTGLMTLCDLDATDAIDRTSAQQFIHALQLAEGGFRAAAWDTECDVEYTFYGLGCLALLQD